MTTTDTILDEFACQSARLQVEIDDRVDILKELKRAERGYWVKIEKLKTEKSLTQQQYQFGLSRLNEMMAKIMQAAKNHISKIETLSRLRQSRSDQMTTDAHDTVVVPNAATDSSGVVPTTAGAGVRGGLYAKMDEIEKKLDLIIASLQNPVGGLSPEASDEGKKRSLSDSTDETSVKRIHVETAADNA